MPLAWILLASVDPDATVSVSVPTRPTLEHFSTVLTYDLTFLPHAVASSPQAAETPILLSTNLAELRGDVLLLLDDHLPEGWKDAFERFSRIIDVVSTDPEELRLSRDRYRAYRKAGVELAAFDRRQ